MKRAVALTIAVLASVPSPSAEAQQQRKPPYWGLDRCVRSVDAYGPCQDLSCEMALSAR
jgi:hypothetical protein